MSFVGLLTFYDLCFCFSVLAGKTGWSIIKLSDQYPCFPIKDYLKLM